MLPDKRWWVLAGAIAWLTALAAALPALAAESTLDVVKKRGTLIAGVRYDTPPFGYVDKDGKVVGVDIEIAKYLANRLSVKLELIQVTAKSRIPMLLNGNVDILAAFLGHTFERDQVIDFSVSYLESGSRFMVKRGSGIASYRDLAGKTVAVLQGTPYAALLLKVQPQAKILTFQEYPQAVVALEQGKADALMLEDIVLAILTRAKPNLEGVGDTRDFPRSFSGLGVRENDSKWRDFVNYTLIEMWENGAWKRVMSEHIPGWQPGPHFEIQNWK